MFSLDFKIKIDRILFGALAYILDRMAFFLGRFLNINGRICLGMSFSFGLLGFIMMYRIEPWLRRIYIRFQDRIKIINIIFVSMFFLDIFINIFFI